MDTNDWHGKYIRLMEVICRLRKQIADVSAHEPPPRAIPPELVDAFTLGGRAELLDFYFDSRHDSRLMSALVPYFKKDIEVIKQNIDAGIYKSYGRTNDWLKRALNKYPIAEKTVLVCGSAFPQYESFVLLYGGRPVTVEYNPRVSDHPSLSFYTPDQWKRSGFPVDAVLSISSFEHDGLGRYGDPINPQGDLEAMRGTLNGPLRSGGILYLSVPIGVDAVAFNAHRIYGYHRLPILLSGWKVLDVFNDSPDFLYEINRDGAITFNSDAWTNHFKVGKTAEEWLFVLQK